MSPTPAPVPAEVAAFVTSVKAAPPTIDLDQLLADLDSHVADLVAAVVGVIATYNAEVENVSAAAVAFDLVRQSQTAGVAFVPGAGVGRGLFIDSQRYPLQGDVGSSIKRVIVAAGWRAVTAA